MALFELIDLRFGLLLGILHRLTDLAPRLVRLVGCGVLVRLLHLFGSVFGVAPSLLCPSRFKRPVRLLAARIYTRSTSLLPLGVISVTISSRAPIGRVSWSVTSVTDTKSAIHSRLIVVWSSVSPCKTASKACLSLMSVPSTFTVRANG